MDDHGVERVERLAPGATGRSTFHTVKQARLDERGDSEADPWSSGTTVGLMLSKDSANK